MPQQGAGTKNRKKGLKGCTVFWEIYMFKKKATIIAYKIIKNLLTYFA